jgi:MFS family permease
MVSALRPLRLPGFPNLGLAYLVNELGNWLGEIALAILVFDQTGSPMATAALFCGMHFAPAVLGPPLVSRLEALPVRITLPSLYAAEAIAFAVLALMVDEFALVAVLALATLDGSIASAARALTRTAATAVLAPAGQLREGNALLNIAFTVGAAGGPAIAGLVVAGAGVETALLADAASFMAVAALLAAARRLELPELEEPESPWTERLRRGFAYVRERPALRRLLAAQALAFVFFSLVIPIEVVFAKRTLDTGDAGYGVLLASWGAGMVVGSVAFAALRRVPLRALLFFSTLAIGVAYLATSVSPTLAVACAASFVGGLGNGVQWIALVTAVQELTRAAYQARVLALLEALASATPGIGFLVGGAIAAIFSPRVSYAVAGAGVIAVLALAAGSLRRAEWSPELEQGPVQDVVQDGASSVAGAGASRTLLTGP